MQIQFDLETIQSAAKTLWSAFSDKKIWAFEAAMGAGKTTFIKTLCNDVLQSKDVVVSPTFSIINEYESKVGKIFHMDWYRLKDEEEAMQSGVDDVLQSGNLCLIEWPGRAPQLLSEDVLFLNIEILNKKERLILIGK